jgi:hypothetical protein
VIILEFFAAPAASTSQGGSNTARNIELLCEQYNRANGDRVQ